MTKTTEDALRGLFKTGYDPVKIEVHARGINEENLEVVIAGHKYSVKGNQIVCLDKSDQHAETPAEAASNAGVPTAEEGNTNSPKSDVAAGADESGVSESGSGDGAAALAEGSAEGDGNQSEDAGGLPVDGGDTAETQHAAEPDAGIAGAGQAGDSAGYGEEALKESTAG